MDATLTVLQEQMTDKLLDLTRTVAQALALAPTRIITVDNGDGDPLDIRIGTDGCPIYLAVELIQPTLKANIKQLGYRVFRMEKDPATGGWGDVTLHTTTSDYDAVRYAFSALVEATVYAVAEANQPVATVADFFAGE